MKKHLYLLFVVYLVSLPFFSQNEYPQRENTHRIMSYNIRNAIGMDRVKDNKRIAAVINAVAPEVVAVQEADSMTTRSNNTYVLGDLADLTGMHATFAEAISFQGGKYGIGILSKKKPLSVEKIPLPGSEELRTLLAVEFDNYILCCTHLSLTAKDAEASVDIINIIAEKFQRGSNNKKPVLLAGDFNVEPGSPTIKKLTENKKWKILSNPKHFTFPSDMPDRTIDYIMGYTANGTNYSVHNAKVVEEGMASDHRPLYVDIRFATEADRVMRTRPYLQKPAPDGMTVMWLTNVPCLSWVEYGTDSTNMQTARSLIEGEMIANNTINKIRLENLTPGTTYYYRVVSREITLYRAYQKEFGETVRSQVHSFRTMDDSNTDFTMLIFNDIHKNYALFDKLMDRVKNIDYELVIFNGDCIDDAETEEMIVETVDYYGSKYGSESIPSVYLRGNHETRGEYSVLLWNYLDRMGDSRTYEGFNIGDTRIVLMDVGEDKPDDHKEYFGMNDFTQYRKDQAAFLKEELSSTAFRNAKKRVLIHHIPIYGGKKGNFNPCLELWGPQLAKAPFDICLNGHTHRFRHIAKNEAGNNFPVVIGGSNRIPGGTVMILEKKDQKMTLRVLDVQGEEKLKLGL